MQLKLNELYVVKKDHTFKPLLEQDFLVRCISLHEEDDEQPAMVSIHLPGTKHHGITFGCTLDGKVLGGFQTKGNRGKSPVIMSLKPAEE